MVAIGTNHSDDDGINVFLEAAFYYFFNSCPSVYLWHHEINKKIPMNPFSTILRHLTPVSALQDFVFKNVFYRDINIGVIVDNPNIFSLMTILNFSSINARKYVILGSWQYIKNFVTRYQFEKLKKINKM
jgi:hypothetical protein